MKKIDPNSIKVRNKDMVALIQRANKGAHQDKRRRVKHKKGWGDDA